MSPSLYQTLLLAGMPLFLVGWALVAVLLVRGVKGPRRRGVRRVWRSSLAIFAVSLFVRVVLASHGPGNLVLDMDYLLRGPAAWFSGEWNIPIAPAALLDLVMRVAPREDATIIWANLLVGASAPVVFRLLLRECGISERLAIAGALLLAVHPLSVRHAGSANTQAFVLFLSTVSLWSLARYQNTGVRRALVLFVAATVLCLHTRAEAVALLGVAGLFVLLRVSTSRKGFSRPVWLAFGCAAVFGLLWFVRFVGARPDDVAFEARLDWLLPDPADDTWLDPAFTPIVTIGLFWAGSIYWGLVRRKRVAIWAFLSVIVLSYPTARMATHLEWMPHLEIASSRYQTLQNLLFLVNVTAGLALVEDFARWAAEARAPSGRVGGWLAHRAPAIAVATLTLVAVGTGVPVLLDVTRPRTVDLEYRFLNETLPQLPDGATIFIVPQNRHRLGDMGLELPIVLNEQYPNATRWAELDGTSPPAGDDGGAAGELFYYHSTGCYYDYEWVAPRVGLSPEQVEGFRTLRGACARALRAYGGRPFITATLPAAPMAIEGYEGEALTVGFYRLAPASPERP